MLNYYNKIFSDLLKGMSYFKYIYFDNTEDRNRIISNFLEKEANYRFVLDLKTGERTPVFPEDTLFPQSFLNSSTKDYYYKLIEPSYWMHYLVFAEIAYKMVRDDAILGIEKVNELASYEYQIIIPMKKNFDISSKEYYWYTQYSSILTITDNGYMVTQLSRYIMSDRYKKSENRIIEGSVRINNIPVDYYDDTLANSIRKYILNDFSELEMLALVLYAFIVKRKGVAGVAQILGTEVGSEQQRNSKVLKIIQEKKGLNGFQKMTDLTDYLVLNGGLRLEENQITELQILSLSPIEKTNRDIKQQLMINKLKEWGVIEG